MDQHIVEFFYGPACPGAVLYFVVVDVIVMPEHALGDFIVFVITHRS